MAALKEGNIYDVTVEPRTLFVDGTEVPALHARPDGMPVAGLVVNPDIWGLRPLFDDMARRLATNGIATLVFEPFAALGADVGTTLEERFESVTQLDDDFQMQVFSAAADLLVVEDDVNRVATLGFCMGGHYVFKAASIDRFDVAVAFYGMLHTPAGWGGPGHRIDPIAVASEMCPTLAIFGTNDPNTPMADIEELKGAWANRTDCEMMIVEGAEHGFVHDPERDAHRPDDAAAAWSKALEWIKG